jgi:hypothetical protein
MSEFVEPSMMDMPPGLLRSGRMQSEDSKCTLALSLGHDELCMREPLPRFLVTMSNLSSCLGDFSP